MICSYIYRYVFQWTNGNVLPSISHLNVGVSFHYGVCALVLLYLEVCVPRRQRVILLTPHYFAINLRAAEHLKFFCTFLTYIHLSRCFIPGIFLHTCHICTPVIFLHSSYENAHLSRIFTHLIPYVLTPDTFLHYISTHLSPIT